MKKHLLSSNHRSSSIRLQIRLIRDELNPSQFAADSTHLSARHHQEIQLDIIEGTQILWTKTLVNGLVTVRNAPMASIGYGQIERTQENSTLRQPNGLRKSCRHTASSGQQRIKLKGSSFGSARLRLTHLPDRRPTGSIGADVAEHTEAQIFSESDESFNFDRFDAREIQDVDRLTQTARTLPMLGQQRLVLVTHAEVLLGFSKDRCSSLIDYLNDPHPTTVIAFYCQGKKSQSKAHSLKPFSNTPLKLNLHHRKNEK